MENRQKGENKDYLVSDQVFEHRRKEFDKIMGQLNLVNQQMHVMLMKFENLNAINEKQTQHFKKLFPPSHL